MRKTWTLATWALAISAAAVLMACGGGGDSRVATAATTSVPASASASVGGWIDYLKALVASAADMLEPVDVSTVTPPTDDASEPAAVD
jgi:hypothetical protein